MMSNSNNGCLALDIGGTKLLVALIVGGRVVERKVVATSVGADPQDWLQAAHDISEAWSGHYSHVAAAITGVLNKGCWFSLNKQTLAVRDGFPLVSALEELFQCTAFAINDAQAAAWAEYRFGAAKGQDMVFLTVSTGVGGGIVLDGTLRQGRYNVAGHFGQWRDETDRPFESTVSGRWFATQANQQQGRPMDAREVFAAADLGEAWADNLIHESSRRVAEHCWNIQLAVDPEVIVLGGGIGLAPGYLKQVRQHVNDKDTFFVPSIVGAQLGDEAGVLGAADLSLLNQRPNVERHKNDTKK